MRSIKKQLMLFIFSIITISTIALITTTYLELKHEMDELFDENMVQIASAIAVHDFSIDNEVKLAEDTSRYKLKGEEEFLIQIWNNEKLSYSSLPAIALPYQGAGGVKTITFNDEEWRFYAVAQNDWLIQVSQPIPVRHTVIREFYATILLPMLIQLPLLMGAIWLVVGYEFKSLRTISTSIEQRSSTFLDKLPEENIPQEINTMVSALNNLLGRLDNALKTQRRFTADAAHELRTPLTAVTLQLDVLRRAKTDAEKEDAISKLYKGVERSTHLVHQLLELTRQEPEAIEMAMEKCDLSHITQEVIDQYLPLAHEKNISLHLNRATKAFINGNKESLNVMIGNLVNNAILYTQKDGTVELSITNAPTEATITVADNGPGIANQEKERIFDRFYRIVGTNTTGSGLGLSIVKTIAEHHGAKIMIEDGINQAGTAFKIVFPR